MAKKDKAGKGEARNGATGADGAKARGKHRKGNGDGAPPPGASAGAGVPDELRRIGTALLEKANSPAGRELIAAGLTMAAAAATAAARKRPEAPRPAPGETAADIPPKPAADGQAIADAIGGAAEMLLGRLFAGKKA